MCTPHCIYDWEQGSDCFFVVVWWMGELELAPLDYVEREAEVVEYKGVWFLFGVVRD